MDAATRTQLAQHGLFHGSDVEGLEYLLDECARFVLAAGATLLEPGAGNDCLYVVLDGELHVHLGGRESPAHAVLGVGECAGELSLLDGQGACALVIAAAETELLVIPQHILWALIERSHGFSRNLLAALAGRVRRDNLALVTTAPRSLEFEQADSVDAVTGLHNRRWLSEAFPRVMRRCQHDDAPLCLVVVGIDHFKRTNEEHGRPAGNALLRAVARRLAESLRTQDLIARYGGDEYAVLLPQTGIAEGQRIAERLRLSIELMKPPVSDRVTVSCGVAALGPDAELENLLERANAALARAKEGGRNRVETVGAKSLV
jgi:diguanylate cyclase (GGDEF)-like protein